MKSKEIQSKLWKILESRDRSLKQGLHRWDKQDQEISLLRKTLEERNLESNEKDKEIELLKGESNEKDEEIEEKDEEIEEKDEEISALKRTLDVRLEKLKELERIRSSWLYQILHMIRHPRKIFKARATNDKMSSLKEKM